MTENPEAPPPQNDSSRTTTVDPLRGSRTSRVYVTIGALVIVLVLLVIFIAQNTQSVEVSFLGWTGHPPLAVALLVAVIAGLVLAGTAGTLRILQLRRRVRRTR